jgi:hypothetical protein
MRRIRAAAGSLVGRMPSLLNLVPDLLLVAGYIVVGVALRDVHPYGVDVALLWYGLVPFVAGAAVEVRAFRRSTR